MGNYYTTRQLQELLQIDRTTIYRMADGGRLPAIKVGNQWRFPKHEIEGWLHSEPSEVASDAQQPPIRPSSQSPQGTTPETVRRWLPVACVQPIQDMLAELLGTMVVITDLKGVPITEWSNACGLYSAPDIAPRLHEICVRLWAELAQLPELTPAWHKNELGLKCARGLIRVGPDLGAMVVVGGVADPTWSPDAQEIEKMAALLDVEPARLSAHIEEVYKLNQTQQDYVLGFVQRMADIVAHIVNERQVLFNKLENIAILSQV